jgi:hypothetical protein
MAMAVAAILELEGAPAREEAEAQAQAGEVDGSMGAAVAQLIHPFVIRCSNRHPCWIGLGSPGLDLPKELGPFQSRFYKRYIQYLFLPKRKNPYLKF